MKPLTPRLIAALALVVVIFLVHAIVCVVVVPIGHGADEGDHLAYVGYLAHEGRLPDPRHEDVGQIQHPPGAYAMQALLLRGLEAIDRRLDDDRFADASGDLLGRRTAFRPGHRRLDDLGLTDAQIEELRGEASAAEIAHWERRAWVEHALRLTSVLLGIATVLFVFFALRAVLPERPDQALLVTAFLAFTPHAPFHFAMISNDPVLTALSAATAMIALSARRRGELFGRGTIVLLAVMLGLSFLVKLHAIGLAAFLAALMATAPGVGARRKLGSIALLALGPLVIAGWWHVRQIVLTGGMLPLEHHARFKPWLLRLERDDPLHPLDVLAQSLESFFGVLGQDYVRSHALYYLPVCGFAVLATFACAFVREPRTSIRRGLAPCALFGLFVLLAAILLANRHYYHLHGRYFYAILVPVALIFALGARRLAGARATMLLATLTAWAGAFCAFTILVVLVNRYAIPLEKVERGRVLAYFDCGHPVFDQKDTGGMPMSRRAELLSRPRDTFSWAQQVLAEPALKYRVDGIDAARRWQVRVRYPSAGNRGEGDVPDPSAIAMLVDSWTIQGPHATWHDLGEMRYPLPEPVCADGSIELWWQNRLPQQVMVGVSELWIEEAWVQLVEPPRLSDDGREVHATVENVDTLHEHGFAAHLRHGQATPFARAANEAGSGVITLAPGARRELRLAIPEGGPRGDVTLQVVDIGCSPWAATKLAHQARGPATRGASLDVPDLEVLRVPSGIGGDAELARTTLHGMLQGPWRAAIVHPQDVADEVARAITLAVERDGERIAVSGPTETLPASFGERLACTFFVFELAGEGEIAIDVVLKTRVTTERELTFDRLLVWPMPDHANAGWRWTVR